MVKNTGQTPLANVRVVDDNGTTSTSDDRIFTVDNLDSGDTNDNGVLDIGETWVFSYTTTALSGKHTNTAVVTGKNLFNTAQIVTDDDPANYIAEKDSKDKDCWDDKYDKDKKDDKYDKDKKDDKYDKDKKDDKYDKDKKDDKYDKDKKDDKKEVEAIISAVSNLLTSLLKGLFK